MSFRNWIKGAKAKALVVLGGFAMLLGVGASVSVAQAAKENEVVETKADASTEVARVYINFTGWANISNVHFNTASSGTYTAARQCNSSASYASHVHNKTSDYWVADLYPGASGSTLHAYFSQSDAIFKGTAKTDDAAKQDTSQSLGVTIQRGCVYSFDCTWVINASDNDKRFGVGSTWQQVGSFARFAFDGGTKNAGDSFEAIETANGVSFTLLKTPTRSGWTFLGWKSSADSDTHAASQNHPAIAAPVTFTAAWSRSTEGSGYIRVWFYPCEHYQEGTRFEWKLWDGVGGSSAQSAVEWIGTHSGSGKYLAYFDVTTSWIGKKIVFQVFDNNNNGDWAAGTVEGEFTLSDGDNAYLLFPYYESSAWHIGKGSAAKCASNNGNHNIQADSEVLERVFLSYQTCNSSKSKGYGNAITLANTWVWDTTSASSSTPNIHGTTSKATAENYLKNYSIFDYKYENGSYDYSSLANKTQSTTLFAKYEAMLNMKNTGGVSGAHIPFGGPVGNESPLTLTLWIVLGAGVAGLAAIGAAYYVSKKKKRPQA